LPPFSSGKVGIIPDFKPNVDAFPGEFKILASIRMLEINISDVAGLF